ncbi:hypothetical protein C7476_1356 [Phyllobacterium bourgognense]|uniref:Uncharacterized protein n=1 Tax=Phyllobacterium bourgognense TaxID=314236 RepID=A0A368YCB5_9HYPH|nr:hypothetical protein C7476_1356 [Phyllobacterium bourgognense]
MRSLILTTMLAVVCLSIQPPAALAGPQDSHPVKNDRALRHTEPQGISQTEPALSIDANSLPEYLATLHKLHFTDGHIEPQD